MRGTALVLCLVLGLTRANLPQVRSALPIEADGSPMPTDCALDHPTWGSFRPYVGDNSHPANCSRFWRCNDQTPSLYSCPPCNPDNHRCHGQPSLMFNIEKKNCDYPEDVTDFFVTGPCGCDKCKACGGVGGTDNELCDLWTPDKPDSCHYCNEDKKCKPGCLENWQCPGELECKNYECVAPCKPDGDTCSKDDAASCDVCSTCQATVSWSCSRPTECCADNPCDECFDCINGNCEPKECGVCNSCVNDVCEPMDCGECGVCKDDDCEDCSDLCPICSKCEGGKCLEPTECCAEKPCDPCEDCVDGTCVKRDCGLCSYCDVLNDKCVPKDCGNCEDCDIETGNCEPRDCGVCNCCDKNTDECKPKDCGECGICKDDVCEDCKDLCPICSTCDSGECLPPTECCDENPCGPCQDCVDGTCVDRDCGLCSNCNEGTDKCEPKDCGDCKDCNILNGRCEDRDCGVCSCCEKDECKPKDCGDCGICKEDVCVDCSELCPVCSKCEDEKCLPPTECCPEKDCPACHTCDVDGNCVPIDCGGCGTCNKDTNECEKDEDQCKPNCGEPDCEICVGVPGKSTFECEHVCADDDEGCCCVDNDCKDYCEADGMVPMCDCEQNKCQCIQTGKIVVNKIIVCTDKCEGCDDDKKVEKMVLNLIGEEKKTGKPECKTAALPINKDKCVEFGKESDQNICAGCYQYPLEGDIDEDSTVEWKGEGTWSGTFCVTWYPNDNMDVKCKVEDGEVTDCDELCDCKDEMRTVCPQKASSKSRKTGGVMGWFN